MAWYNVNWDYRRKIVVTNNIASDITDFQVLFTLDTAALVTAGKMQADGDDIIFADLAGVSQDYWIESGMNTNATKIWVEVKSITASSTKDIYLYYGNAGAGEASDGDATFDFFDDFDDGSLDASKWTVVSGVEDTDFHETGGNMVMAGNAGTVPRIRGTKLSRDRIFEHRVRFSSTDTKYLQIGVIAVAGTNDFDLYTQGTDGITSGYTRASGSITWIGASIALGGMDTWQTYKFEWTSTSAKIFYDNTQWSATALTNIPSVTMGADIRGHTSGYGTMYIDWTRARKYASTEPTHGAWGNEETNGGPAVDVDVTYLPILTTDIDTAITNARTGANNKYFNVPIVNDMQIMFIHISQ